MATHYAATGTRTLCGALLSDRMDLAHLWPDFLKVYTDSPGACCERCLKAAKRWQRFAYDLAAVNERRRQERARNG